MVERNDFEGDFEVIAIISHIKIKKNMILYRVRWKPVTFTCEADVLQWISDVKNIQKMYVDNRITIQVEWKDSWLPTESLEGCDEILPAYILSNIKKSADAISAHQKFKEVCHAILQHAESLEMDEHISMSEI
eukprot:488514_1